MKSPLLASKAIIYCFLLLGTVLNSYAQTENDTADTLKIAENTNSQINDIIHLNNDVYAIGSYTDERLSNYGIACYWKNGKLFPISKPGTGNEGSKAITVAVENNDIYIIGQASNTSTPFLFTCWKNGKWEKDIELSKPKVASGDIEVDKLKEASTEERFVFVEIIDMAVYHNDLYILGSVGDQTYYWKNSELITLDSPDDLNNKSQDESAEGKRTTGHAIYIYNGDVYVAGSIAYDYYHKKPVYWKNGKCNLLTLPESKKKIKNNGNDTSSGEASGIFVNEARVWLSGIYYNGGAIACYWKNNEFIELSPWYAKARTTSILVKGEDVYVGGFMEDYDPDHHRMACYWKNGKVIPVSEINAYEYFSPTVKTMQLTADNQITAYITLGDNYSNQDTRYGHSVYRFSNGKLKALKLETPDPASASIAQTSDVEVSAEGDVYALGYAKAAGNAMQKPVFWKNGKRQELSMPPNSTIAQSFGIAVEKNDQVILGYCNDTTSTENKYYYSYCYWRNGKYQKFDGSFIPAAAKILNGNLYVTGYKTVYNKAKDQSYEEGIYYINNKQYKLALPVKSVYTSCVPTTISVEPGGKVYIAGYMNSYDKNEAVTHRHPALWINGILTQIPPVNAKYTYYSTQINIKQNKPEVIGLYYYSYTDKAKKEQHGTGGYSWQAGSAMKLYPVKALNPAELKSNPAGLDNLDTSCKGCLSTSLFFTDGGQQHALINIADVGTAYALNGKPAWLPVTPGKFGGKNEIHSLTVRNGKAYVGGNYLDEEGNQKACYWVDGKRVELE